MESDSDGPSSPSSVGRHLDAAGATWGSTPSSSANLDRLASQLDDLQDLEGSGEWTCCCNGRAESSGCRSEVWREGMEEKLKLAGEVGQALLGRYEALEKRYERDKEKWSSQLDIKSKSLDASITRVHNLEKANTTHMQKYAEMSRKQEALEKRYTQALHTQTLTQQSLTHVRAELTTMRKTSNRQSIALASGAGVEDRLLDAERRLEEARDLVEVETKKARDEARHRKRAESRIAELETQLAASKKELEDAKEGRAKDAQDLLNNAKERLELLHSETFNADSPADAPEYQKALESLVADNALLRHDTSELSHRLAEARDENRILQQEVDDLRTVIATSGRTSPQTYASLSGEVRAAQHHHRTESTPLGGALDRGWARMSIARPPLDHHRRSSMAPSFTSTSSTTDGLVSPGLGLGSVGEYGAPLIREAGSLSPTGPSEGGRQSPKSGILRTSPSGGIGYVLNGVPKRPGARPAAMRRISMEVTSRLPSGIDAIPEWAGVGQDSMSDSPEEPLRSPGSLNSARAAEHSRKRRSLMLSRRATMSPSLSEEYSRALSNTDTDDPRPMSPMSDSAVGPGPSPAKKIHRRTLMLLSKNKGVQTDSPVPPTGSLAEQIMSDAPLPPVHGRQRHTRNMQSLTSVDTNPLDERSETGSMHDRSSLIASLVDHISRMLARLRAADVPTLNKRLRKHNLPSDVGHVSRTTMRALQQEVVDLRLGFKGIPDSSSMSRRDFGLLVKLLKDIFAELIDLQEMVNNVTIDPKLAKKLRAEAFRSEDEDAAAGGAGLGWIPAPITKFFVTPAAEPEVQDTATVRGRQERERRKLAVGTARVPKQAAVASATTTHVSIEFGGTGIVRRAIPAAPSSTSTPPIGEEGNAPESEGMRVVSSTSTASGPASEVAPSGSDLDATLRPVELRRAKSRANRNELLGIFAGATRPISPTGGGNWVVLPDPVPPVPKLRTVSSRHFKAADAPVGEGDGSEPPMPPPPVPMGRGLHKRGLSDSSIRSTFVSHGEDIGSGIIGAAGTIEAGPALTSARQGAYPAHAGYGGVFGAISRRWYGKPVESTERVSPSLKDPYVPSAAKAVPEGDSKTKTEPTIAITSPSSTSAKPIPVSPMKTSGVSITGTSPSPRSISGSSHGGGGAGGLLGYLASSLSSSAAAAAATASDEEPLSEDEMLGATLRHQAMMGGRRSQSRRRV